MKILLNAAALTAVKAISGQLETADLRRRRATKTLRMARGDVEFRPAIFCGGDRVFEGHGEDAGVDTTTSARDGLAGSVDSCGYVVDSNQDPDSGVGSVSTTIPAELVHTWQLPRQPLRHPYPDETMGSTSAGLSPFDGPPRHTTTITRNGLHRIHSPITACMHFEGPLLLMGLHAAGRDPTARADVHLDIRMW